MRLLKGKIFYGWYIVLATNIICLLGFGTWLYSFGVFFKPMMAEFGWTRAMTAGAASLRSVEGGVAGPVVGWAVDRYGSRVVIIVGAIISGLGFALMPFVNSLLGFYIAYGLIVSIGMSAMLYIPAFTVLAYWFKRRLSLALSLLAVGAGLGGLLCAPASALLVQRLGWRSAFLVIGVMMWIVVIPLALVVRDRPEEKGLTIDGDPPPEPDPTGEQDPAEAVEVSGPKEGRDYTIKEAMQSRAFWLLALTFFLQSAAYNAVIVHSIPAMTDAGITAATAAFSFGLMTLVSIVGRMTFGTLGDYVDKRYLFMITYGIMGLGVLVLMKPTSMFMVYLFVALFGIGFGGTVPLMPAIRAEYFGRTALGKVQGFMNPVVMVAGATGPFAAGHLFDQTGTYYTSFLLAAFLAFGASITVFFAKPSKLPAK